MDNYIPLKIFAQCSKEGERNKKMSKVMVAFTELESWIENKRTELHQRTKYFISDETQDKLDTEITLLNIFREVVRDIKAKAIGA